jgi:excinuclease ABC subunit C
MGLKIPLVGLAKGPERKRNDVVGAVPKNVSLRTLIQVRDEAHRFAISYHKVLRRVKTFE